MSEEIKVDQEPTQEEIKEIEENFDFEYTTRMDYVSCAYYSISAVEGIDLLLLTKDEARKIKKIIKKSIRIIESCINEMHDELFEDEEEN
jgi:galactitol-specific phosphotransferase system IIB component